MTRLCIFFIILFSFNSFGGVSETLPAGINSPIFKFGFVQGINQKYDSQGQLWRIGDLRSVQFDAKTIAKINPKAETLINTLNRFGNQNLGDDLNLGVLRFDIDPKISYFAPVYARGFTDNWTLGIAFPILTYTNNIHVSNSFSNIEFYRREFSGRDPELDEALNTDLRTETLRTIEQRGYKALESKKETFLHDIQLVSFFKFWQVEDKSLLHSFSVGLPTGPRYDSDDLAALNISARTTLDTGITYAQSVAKRWKWLTTVSVLYTLPDRITMRVPKNEDDILPDTSSKEAVLRQIGPKGTWKNELNYNLSDRFVCGAGYSFAEKNSDQYSGSQGFRYDLLGKDSQTREQVASFSVAYDTVQSYFRKEFLLPMIVSYDISDLVVGLNIERRLIQEINFILFF